jgi:hypothetical protein
MENAKPAFHPLKAAAIVTPVTEVDMRGYIIAEDRFLHQGIDHHLFVTGIENEEYEYRFEVTRIPPGGETPETIFEKIVNFSSELARTPNTPLGDLMIAELSSIKAAVYGDEDLHIHDP